MVLFNRHVSSDEKFDEHNMTLHWNMIGLPKDLEVGHEVNLFGHRVALSSKSACLRHALTGYLPNRSLHRPSSRRHGHVEAIMKHLYPVH